ncbi:MAG: regulator of cell morphogenesis and NO signaling [Myxococcota bacterium]|jgi:regulator of cell morphogenesis and NO signaling
MQRGNTSLGQLVTNNPAAAPVLHSFGLDFCCGGERTLSAACEADGVDFESVTLALSEAGKLGDAEVPNFDAMSVQELIDYVIVRFHEPQVVEIDRLLDMYSTVCRVHGKKWPEAVREIGAALGGLAAELLPHFQKEEMILFPMMIECDPQGPLKPAIQRMLGEHDAAAEALGRLVETIAKHPAPPDGCAATDSLWAGMKELDLDVRRHVHYENATLFPRALAELG